jgi:SnoaL-like polyketide cyclase
MTLVPSFSGTYSSPNRRFERQENAMTREEIVALFTRREASWHARDAASLAADHAANGVVISPTGGVLEGRIEIERIYRVWFTAFPDLVFTTEDLLVDEDRAALLCRITGSHAGEFFGMAPTGRRIEVSGAFIYRVDHGLIAHERRILDFTGLLVQVGVLRAKPAG